LALLIGVFLGEDLAVVPWFDEVEDAFTEA
jgi:hypothetical protein